MLSFFTNIYELNFHMLYHITLFEYMNRNNIPKLWVFLLINFFNNIAKVILKFCYSVFLKSHMSYDSAKYYKSVFPLSVCLKSWCTILCRLQWSRSATSRIRYLPPDIIERTLIYYGRPYMFEFRICLKQAPGNIGPTDKNKF